MILTDGAVLIYGRSRAIMSRKHKAVKVAEHGFLTDENNEAIICPIRGANCNIRCAWFSADEQILYCKDTVIGAVRGREVHATHIHTVPSVYNVDKSLTRYKVTHQKPDRGN